MARVDVVIVSFNSRVHLRPCVEPLVALDDVNVIVVDNASRDGTLETVADLNVTAVALDANAGFAVGCNVGWRAGRAPFVLFLNPDARLDEMALRELTSALDGDERIGAVAPRIVGPDGDLHFSQRRFPSVRSTYAQALFLHRLFWAASWSDEVIRDRRAYEVGRSVDWLAGACLLVRRGALAELGGFDEGFFMYCEDTDLCRRLHGAGYDVRFDPRSTVMHVGGASAPRSTLLPVLAASRMRYARKHFSRFGAALERAGIALSALTHAVVSRSGPAARRGHLRALRIAISGVSTDGPLP